MEQAQLQARARQRAKDERVRINAVPGRPGVYWTRSKSDPNERYTLVAKDGVVACSCRGYEYRANCKHVEQLKDRMAREANREPKVSLLPSAAA